MYKQDNKKKFRKNDVKCFKILLLQMKRFKFKLIYKNYYLELNFVLLAV